MMFDRRHHNAVDNALLAWWHGQAMLLQKRSNRGDVEVGYVIRHSPMRSTQDLFSLRSWRRLSNV